jgi:hypothetical protein
VAGLRWAWSLKHNGVGDLPFEDHQPLVARALLYEMDGALKRWHAEELNAERSASHRKQRRTRYDTPVVTDDPIVNEWEQAIARGEMPDLDAPSRRSP